MILPEGRMALGMNEIMKIRTRSKRYFAVAAAY